MLRWLLNNLGTLALAILLALLVWGSAVNAADPTQARTFADGIAIEYAGMAEDLILLGSPPASAAVIVRAPRSILDQLTPQEIHVTAELTGLASGRHQVTLVGLIDRQPARALSIEPSTVILTIERVSTRNVPVQVRTVGSPAVGYRLVTQMVAPTQVAVAGPASAVDQVAQVLAEVNVTDQRQDIDQLVRLIPVDSTGQSLEGLRLEPDSVRVTASIERLGGYRDVAVKLVIQGEVDPGYALARLTISPPVVTVYSPDASAVAVLPGFVETEPLDLTGSSSSFERRLALDLPEGITPVGAQTVLVQVEISAIESSLTLTLPVEFQGLGSGLAAVASPDSVSVILNGPVSVLSNLQPGDVRVYLDLRDLRIGTYRVTAQVVVLPAGVITQTILPEAIQVTIGWAAPATATP